MGLNHRNTGLRRTPYSRASVATATGVTYSGHGDDNWNKEHGRTQVGLGLLEYWESGSRQIRLRRKLRAYHPWGNYGEKNACNAKSR